MCADTLCDGVTQPSGSPRAVTEHVRAQLRSMWQWGAQSQAQQQQSDAVQVLAASAEEIGLMMVRQRRWWRLPQLRLQMRATETPAATV